jgi:hypothetical protein
MINKNSGLSLHKQAASQAVNPGNKLGKRFPLPVQR